MGRFEGYHGRCVWCSRGSEKRRGIDVNRPCVDSPDKLKKEKGEEEQ